MVGTALAPVVSSFVDDLTDALAEASEGIEGVDPEHFRSDVVAEALNLTAAMVDADGRHTDDELNALIDAFGPRLEDSSLLLATPADLRGTDLVAGRREWLETDSELFEVLLAADTRRGTTLADRYYDQAMALAHVVASLDVVTSREELRAIAELRTRLLSRLRERSDDGRSVTPGSLSPEGTTGAAGSDAAAAGSEGVEEADAADDPPPRPLEELLAELDDLVGLDAVKDRVHLVADFLRVQQLRGERNLPAVETSNHLVFTGNPGTGKTTVARLLAQIFRSLGVVERGHLVEVDRSGLVAGYIGQTAPKVTAAFDAADEGMLFIDEAYSLVRGGPNDFGREAIDQVVKLIEDRRERVVLVVAGYTEEMDEFLSANPGLRSRLPTVIEFPDYDTEELVEIVSRIGDRQRYHLGEGARERLAALIDSVPRTKGFGNARLARNVYESAVNRHASRVVSLDAPDEEDLTTLRATDIPESVEAIDQPPRRRTQTDTDGSPATAPTDATT